MAMLLNMGWRRATKRWSYQKLFTPKAHLSDLTGAGLFPMNGRKAKSRKIAAFCGSYMQIRAISAGNAEGCDLSLCFRNNTGNSRLNEKSAHHPSYNRQVPHDRQVVGGRDRHSHVPLLVERAGDTGASQGASAWMY